MSQKTFSIEINIAESFTVDEIWPDGGAPESPTVEDVREVFFRANPNVHSRCADWGLEIRKEDVHFTVHDPKEVQKLRELSRQLRERKVRVVDLPPVSCKEFEPVPLGPGKCPSPDCENLEDGNCPTGQCMECVKRAYEQQD